MRGIAEMFAELSGYEEYRQALEDRADWLTMRKRLNVRLWRINNPKKYKALRDKCNRNYRKKYPEKVRAYRKAKLARDYAKDPEKVRAKWRKRQRDHRARKKASK